MYCHGHVKIEMNLLEAAFCTNAYPSIRVMTQAHTEIKQGKAQHKFFSVSYPGIYSILFHCYTVLIFNNDFFGFNALFSVTLYLYVNKL
jgi:hypothetical protein